jgi:hypothetical protein
LWRVAEEEILDILNADEFRVGGKWNKYIIRWANRAIRDICMEIDVRYHLRLSCSRTFTTTDASVALDDDFFKISDRFTKARVGEDYIDIISLEDLYSYDPDHDQTTTNSNPDYIAIEGNRLYVYPMFSGTLVLENFFRAPVDMTAGDSSPDLPDDIVLQDLLISAICRKGFRLKGDLDLKREYENDYAYYLDLYRLHLDKSNSREEKEFKDF